MSILKRLILFAPALLLFGCAHPAAQVGFGVQYGPEPVCPYGYFDYPPYNCAPWGYYGPGWFRGGVFIGAGPWYHGPAHFRGHVDNHFDPQHGYHGELPRRGEQRDRNHDVGHMSHFHGNEVRSPRAPEKHGH